MKKKVLAIGLALPGLLWLQAAHAVDAAVEKGREISRRVADGERGYGDEVSVGRLTMQRGTDAGVPRVFRMYTLEKQDAGDKRAVVFLEPKDIAGFVSLNYSGLTEPDQQWIYLPQLDKVRRLSARDRSGSFAGSEFSFEEIVRWEYEKYEYRSAGQQDCGGTRPCEVVEETPRYEFSNYSKLVEWIDMDILQPRRIIYHDTTGKPIKQLELLEYKSYGSLWRPMKLRMTHLGTGAVSEIAYQSYEFKTGLKEADFGTDKIVRWSSR